VNSGALDTNPMISHEWEKDRVLITTNGTYLWSFVTQILRKERESTLIWSNNFEDKSKTSNKLLLHRICWNVSLTYKVSVICLYPVVKVGRVNDLYRTTSVLLFYYQCLCCHSFFMIVCALFKVIYCLFISVLSLDIPLSEGGSWDPIIQFTPPHLYACLKPI
jgi:hypothetical protein